MFVIINYRFIAGKSLLCVSCLFLCLILFLLILENRQSNRYRFNYLAGPRAKSFVFLVG